MATYTSRAKEPLQRLSRLGLSIRPRPNKILSLFILNIRFQHAIVVSESRAGEFLAVHAVAKDSALVLSRDAEYDAFAQAGAFDCSLCHGAGCLRMVDFGEGEREEIGEEIKGVYVLVYTNSNRVLSLEVLPDLPISSPSLGPAIVFARRGVAADHVLYASIEHYLYQQHKNKKGE